jgi:hypothetical protein
MMVRSSGDLRACSQKGSGQVLAIHTRTNYRELFKFKYFAAIAKGCASLPESQALLMQLCVPAIPRERTFPPARDGEEC